MENADLVADQLFTELFTEPLTGPLTGPRGVMLDGVPTVEDV